MVWHYYILASYDVLTAICYIIPYNTSNNSSIRINHFVVFNFPKIMSSMFRQNGYHTSTPPRRDFLLLNYFHIQN